eukprot:TRINITY_DN6550_c0_g1_i1.p2 TRINITY_DN6550_c0_g1~~TRINITY_DN6550_c0_g1_i1.p2  ORF type:complete len:526 (+),score=190.83 TRINITY_DN6550_c0_g1_i1:138-1580(+)
MAGAEGRKHALFAATDKYQLVRQVGQGSFGVALLVSAAESGRLLIAKELNLAQMDVKEREAVDSEVTLLRSLKHPNIVRYEECIHIGSVLYLVMEYADGGDLFVKVQGLTDFLSEDEALNLFAQTCLAIKHLHDRRILHRDLKTQNIFVTQTGVVKLGDFGLATCLRHNWQQAQTMCGTPNYFSPELVRGCPYGNKSDIWSLGCVLYELLCRQMAFNAPSLHELMRRICDESPAPVPAQYSQQLQHLLGKMLAKEQGIRPNISTILRARVLQAALQQIEALLKVQQNPLTPSSAGPGSVLRPKAFSPQAPGPQVLSRGGSTSRMGRSATSSDGAAKTRDEELAALENDILTEAMSERPTPLQHPADAGREGTAGSGLCDDLGDTLLLEVQQALADLEPRGGAGGDEEFGDADAYSCSTPVQLAATAAARRQQQEAQLRSAVAAGAATRQRGSVAPVDRRLSLSGEVDNLLADLGAPESKS